MNEDLRLSVVSDVSGAKDVDALGNSLARIPPLADRTGKSLESSATSARSAASVFQTAGSDLAKFAGATLKGIEATAAFVGAHTLATGSLAKYSTELLHAGSATDLLTNGYRALRLALSPTLFTAASVGVGLVAEETLKLVNARGKLIEQQALIAAKGGLSFGTVESIGAAAGLSGGNASSITAVLSALQKRAGTAKYTDAMDSIGIPKYLQNADGPRLLSEIAKGFSNIKDPAITAKAAVDLFGKDLSGSALSELTGRFADSSKAVDEFGLTLSDTSRNQIYEFRRDIQNFKDDVHSLGTSFEALGEKIKQGLEVGGAKTYVAVKRGISWYSDGLDNLDERYGTKNPFTVNEEAKRNIKESPEVLAAALRARGNPAGKTIGMGIQGDMFTYNNRAPGRDDFEERLTQAKSLQTEAKKALAGGDLSAAQITSLSTTLLGTAQEINAAKASLQGIDISKRQSEALRGSQELVWRSQFDPSAGRNIRGELEKASSYVDSDTGEIRHFTMLDGTRRNIESAFQTYALGLMQKTSAEAMKANETESQARLRLEENFWRRRQAFTDETARLDLDTIKKTFAQQNTLAGYLRDERLSGLGSIDPNSPTAVRDRLSQIGQRRSIQTDFATSTSINDAATIEREQQAALIGVAVALRAGSISQADAADRYKAISVAGGQAGSALNSRFEHDILLANADASRETREVLRDVLERQTEALKGTVGGLFNAVTGGNASRAIPDFLKSEALSFGKTITENFATQKLLPAIKPYMPTSSNPLFKDTFLFDPVKELAKRPAGTVADPIYVAAMGGGSGVAGAAGGGGGALSGVDSLSSLIFHGFGKTAASLGTDALGDLIPDIGALNRAGAAVKVPGAIQSGAGFGLNIGTLAKGAAVAGAGISAFSDFATGGIKNDIAGIGSTLMAGSGVAAMFGPAGAPVAAGLAIAAAATSFVSALFPDPHKVRAEGIRKALEENQYHAPTAINAMMSSGGGFADFDSHNNLRTSNFSPYPQTTNPYTWWGPNNTPYQVPGAQTGQFGPTQAASAQEVHVHIHAIDTQSAVAFIDQNHMAIGDATGKALQKLHGTLSREVARAAKYS